MARRTAVSEPTQCPAVMAIEHLITDVRPIRRTHDHGRTDLLGHSSACGVLDVQDELCPVELAIVQVDHALEAGHDVDCDGRGSGLREVLLTRQADVAREGALEFRRKCRGLSREVLSAFLHHRHRRGVQLGRRANRARPVRARGRRAVPVRAGALPKRQERPQSENGASSGQRASAGAVVVGAARKHTGTANEEQFLDTGEA